MDEGVNGLTETRPIDVIIADDHAIVRDGIRLVLEREEGEPNHRDSVCALSGVGCFAGRAACGLA